jgi:hypothetical protein
MWADSTSCMQCVGCTRDASSFFQAVELNPQDQSAAGIVAQMDELFEIDAQTREQALSQEDRQLLRLKKSKPLLDEIKSKGFANLTLILMRT